MGKWYKILGIPYEMAKELRKDHRKDLIVYEENGKINFRIRLNPIELLHMKFQIARYNLTNPCVIRLEKDV